VRVGLVNYPSPTSWASTIRRTPSLRNTHSEPERLLPYGGVHARFTRDPVATSIA